MFFREEDLIALKLLLELAFALRRCIGQLSFPELLAPVGDRRGRDLVLPGGGADRQLSRLDLGDDLALKANFELSFLSNFYRGTAP
jgi:hypothetical protein